MMADTQLEDLRALLRSLAPLRIAVSGGVDSTTLALVAGRLPGPPLQVFHALSPAVPEDGSERVRQIAEREGWQLHEIHSGEFGDPNYLANPYDRCYHCKTNLYRTIAAQGQGVILSGANQDDLSDYRPGLIAAREHQVRHPFIECNMGKADIRRICGALGYPQLAELAASPCLASRIETGIPIDAGHLGFVYRVEAGLRQELGHTRLRCRVRQRQIALELDAAVLDGLTEEQTQRWSRLIGAWGAGLNLPDEIVFEPYRMGSAFVQPK